MRCRIRSWRSVYPFLYLFVGTLFFVVGGYWLLRSLKDPIMSVIDGVSFPCFSLDYSAFLRTLSTSNFSHDMLFFPCRHTALGSLTFNLSVTFHLSASSAMQSHLIILGFYCDIISFSHILPVSRFLHLSGWIHSSGEDRFIIRCICIGYCM